MAKEIAYDKLNNPETKSINNHLEKNNIFSISYRILCFMILIILFNSVSFAEEKKVLVLNSYHQGYEWTDQIVNGIQQTLGRKIDALELFIEYMDAKRIDSQEYLKRYFELFQMKYEKTHLDTIIATDDNAFQFLLQYCQFVQNTPVVFCGVNDFEPSMILNNNNFTGVVQQPDIRATINFALTLNPTAKRVVTISDASSTGQAYQKNVLRESKYYSGMEFVHLDGRELTHAMLLSKLREISDDSIVLMTIWLKDKTGAFIPWSKGMPEISAVTPVPIYGLVEAPLRYGLFGGKIQSGFYQGQKASDLALRIMLQHELPQNIPVDLQSPNKFIFNYSQLMRWKISENQLPKGSVVLEKPESFYLKHKYLFWSAVCIFICMLFTIIILSFTIAKRRKIEASLVESERKYREFIENAPVGIFTTDRQGKFTYGNKMLLEMTGYGYEDWLNKSSDQVVHPDDFPMVIEKIETARREQKTMPSYEIRIYKANEAIMWVEITAINLYKNENGKKGEIFGSQWFIIDVTERKIAEEEKKKLENRLLQAQKMESIGTLAGGIAHDFNNILFPIMGYTEMLMEDVADNPTAKRHLEDIFIAAKRAKDLVQQILAFSRQKTAEYIPLRIQTIIKEALKLLRASIPATIEIRQQINNNCRAVMIDPTQIHQIIMNLCTNAFQAMQETGGRLEVKLSEVELGEDDPIIKPDMKPGGYAHLTVSDTGHGIAPHHLERLFDPYFTTKEPGKGTGLGLSVTHGIVKSHGGDILVFSELGQGSIFHVYLPLIEKIGENATTNLTEPEIGGEERILLVDDEESIAMMMKQMLERLKYQVTAKTSSIEALDAFRFHSDEFDLIISDTTMPIMTGELLAKKAAEIKPDIPVILCTGFSERINTEVAKSIGIRAIVMKPVVKRELAKTIRDVLDN